MTDDYGIHPPNVVLVNSSGQTSPDHNPHGHEMLCSPLSTAPNSPYRVSYDEHDDDEDDEEGIEISPEEIQAVLDTPASNKRIRGVVVNNTTSEVPFDEGHKAEQTTTTIDPLLGNRRHTKPAVVSPMHMEEDIDAYVDTEEDDDDDHTSDEKKEESNTPPPPRPPSLGTRKIGDYSSSAYPRVVVSRSEDDSIPHDERQPKKDFMESLRTNEDNNKIQRSPMKEALQSASLEVQEMEKRVQQMIEKRRHSAGSTSATQQQQQKSTTDLSTSYDIDGEPPSLSPRRGAGDVHSSLDSGCSSYYYDGSAMGSISTNTDDINNTTLESTSSSALGGGGPRIAMSIHPPLEASKKDLTTKDNYYHSRSRSSSAVESSRDETVTSSSGTRTSSSTDKDIPARMDPATFEAFRARFESPKTSNNNNNNNSGSFANIVSGTSKAFHQVTDDLANFLAGEEPPEASTKRRSSRSSSKKYNPPPEQEYPPVSPSHDSDCTPHRDNLSPRRPSVKKSEELLYRQKPSAKLAKARSLVSGRSINAKSPTTAPYIQQSINNNNNNNNSSSKRERDDPMQRARQVMNKRELERPSSSSKSKRSSSRSRDRDVVGAAKRTSNNGKKETSDPMNIPAPPTLYRLAAMMEGLGGGSTEETDDAAAIAKELSSSGAGSDADWPSSVSQFMENYQTAITESLRNLSIDEITGLAQNGKQHQQQEYKTQPGFGNDTMVSPGISLSASRDADDDNINMFSSLKDDEYDTLMSEMTFGACLQMPDLDHPPTLTTRSNSTAQPPQHSISAIDYGKGVAGVLQYDEFQYHNAEDEEAQHQEYPMGEDPEHQDRAVFAKQLSERLMNLGPNCSTDTSGTVEDHFSSPDKLCNYQPEPDTQNGTSFDSKDSSFAMSPPKRGNPGDVTNMTEPKAEPGLFVSSMRRSGDLPHSEQPSVASSSMATPSSKARGKQSSAPNSAGERLADIKPTMVESIDNETGIARGDVMLSLLCDNSFQASKDKPDSWAWRVKEAIWRGREMRRDTFGLGGRNDDLYDDGDPREIRRTSSLPVDVDDVRVVGGIKNVASIQEKALAHLERDEFEQALELYEDIIFNYYSFFEQVLSKRDEFSSEDVSMELSNFKPYIGASLHNLGVIHLLKGDYEDAFSFFKRAVDNRRACLGEAHPDTVTSMVRLATCRFAMDNFADAHTNLELSLALAGSRARTTNDYCQLGEILNNLGCLSYMCGQPTKAMKLFRESLDVQLAVLNSTLYGGSKYSAHSATLNISITRGNIGFLALVLKDVSSGILALEAALREQRLLLSGAHVTLVSTMDHLAVANLLEGRTQKAVKMLRRIYELQKAAHGPNDVRCRSTRQKIMTIRGQQPEETNTSAPDNSRQLRPPSRNEEEAKSSQLEQPEVNARPQLQTNAEMKQSSRSMGEAPASSRCTSIPGSSGNGGGKVNSLFKSFRSLGRKKT